MTNKCSKCGATVVSTTKNHYCPFCGHDIHQEKLEKRRRLFLEMGVDTINDIYNQIKTYSKYMDKVSFQESKEVKALYDELEKLININNVYC